MPTKFKPSVTKFEKQSNGTQKKSVDHFYMRCTSTKEIMAAYESTRIPKYKDKLKKELVRRGVLDANV
jgi:hypothetical protein